jgi:serine/threonine protein kinase/Tfp pilus assembly protein PilF
MNTDFTSGCKPERLKELLSLGLEGFTEEKEVQPASPLDLFIEKPGNRIGCYELRHLLGEGAIAVVYLAQQQQPVKRQVALKIIKPGMDSKAIIARFEAERQALALLDHPNIAHIYDAGATEDKRPYFAMEYVEGLTITEYCDKNRLPAKQRLHLFLKVCLAVHHAHQKGIIHRDIKPSNILVSPLDGQPVPKVIDFGLAKAIRGSLSGRTLVTEQGQLLGTLEYMSPEQVDMANEDIDTRSDIYSLGVLLYVLLTGVLPFDSATFREGGIDQIRQVIREIDPKAPSTMLSSLGEEAQNIAEKRRNEVGALARCLHKELEWIPLKAMRKKRAERYRSVSELADDIENYLAGAPLIAGPPGMLYRLKKFAHRNRALVTGIVAVLAVLVVGVIVSTLFAIGQARARAEADAVSDFLQKNVLRSLNLWDVKGEEITARSILDAASQGLEGELATEPLVEASIRWTLANSYTWLGLYQPAEFHARRALEIRKAQLGTQDTATLASFFELGWVYFYQSRYNEAVPLLIQALKGMELTLDEQHGNRLYCMATLGCVYTMQGRLTEAEQLFKSGLSIVRRVWGGESEHSPTFLQGLAWIYQIQGRYEEAEPLFKQALAISRRMLGERHWEMLTLKHNLGYLYCDMGRCLEAERLLVEALDGRRRVLGEQHSHTLMTMCALGWVYYNQGRYKQAEPLFFKALDIGRRTVGESHICSLYSMFGLGNLYLSQGQYNQAEPLLDKALEIGSRVMGQDNWAILKVRNTLAKLYTEQGRYKEAEETFRQALEARKNKLGPDHPDTLKSKNDLAILYKAQSIYDKAEPLFIQALEVRRLKLGDTHPHTIKSWHNLIDLYEAWNKPEQANKWRAKLLQTKPAEK